MTGTAVRASQPTPPDNPLAVLRAAIDWPTPSEWLLALLLAASWPLLFLGPGRAGYAIGVAGCLLLVALVLEFRGSTAAARAHRTLLLATMALGALATITAIASWPFVDNDWRRLVLFAVLALPSFYGGLLIPLERLARPFVVFGGLLMAWAVAAGELPAATNPIAAGWVAVGVVLCLVSYRFPALLRIPLLVLAALFLMAGDRQSPLVAAVAGATWLAGVIVFRTSRRRGRGRPAAIAVAVVAGSSLGMFSYLLAGEIAARAEGTGLRPAHNVHVRLGLYENALERVSFAGHGLTGVAVDHVGRLHVHSHNFLLDLLLVSGVAGLSIVSVLLVAGGLNALRRKERLLAWPFAYIAGAMASGGGYENVFAWFALGALLHGRCAFPRARAKRTGHAADQPSATASLGTSALARARAAFTAPTRVRAPTSARTPAPEVGPVRATPLHAGTLLGPEVSPSLLTGLVATIRPYHSALGEPPKRELTRLASERVRPTPPPPGVGSGPFAPKPILWVVKGTEGYGVARGLVSLTAYLTKRGWPVRVLALHPGRLVAPLRAAGVDIREGDLDRGPPVHPGTALGQVRLAWQIAAYQREVADAVADELNRSRYDICHFRTLDLLPAIGRACRAAGAIPVWEMPAGPSSRYPFGLNRRLLLRAVHRYKVRVIANSSHTARTMQPLRPSVQELGVSSTVFSPDRPDLFGKDALGIPADTITIGVFARLVPDKGPHLVAEALAFLARTGRLPRRVVLLLAGEGPADYLAIVRDSVANVPKVDVRVLGHLDDPGRWYGAVDVGASMRISPEPFGFSVIECMMAGRPAVVHAAGGPADTVAHEETGWHVPSPTVPALCRVLERAFEDEPMWPAMGRAARRRAVSRYSIEARAHRYMRYVRRL